MTRRRRCSRWRRRISLPVRTRAAKETARRGRAQLWEIGVFIAALDRFPGPLTIGVSIPRHLALLAIACGFVAVRIAFIRSRETFLASFAAGHHGPVRGEGFLRLLIFLHPAHDMPQALAVLGWIALSLFGFAGLVAIFKLMLSVSGLWGITLDGDGFTVRAFTVRGKSNLRHRWLDVGDFDSMALSKAARKRYWVKRCVIFNDYQAPESLIEWLRLTGRNRALVEAYRYPAEDFAVLMSAWRSRAIEDDIGQNG
jgi:hypothetical protein